MTKVEELEIAIRKHLKECNVRETDPPRFKVLNEILEAIVAARAEGAEQERGRLKKWLRRDEWVGEYLPAFVLSPKEEKP